MTRILYVEDEPDIREIAKLSMEAVGGFTVQACASGPDAIDQAAGFHPDLILLDVMMPGMDGPTTLAEIRKIPAVENIPVAFMTAKVQPSEVAILMQLGAVGVIAKPFDPMTLPAQINALLEKSHA